jgi:hypothetical protein
LLAGAAVFCVAVGALDWWLWHVRRVHSMELLFVQARALLALAPEPPARVLLSSPPFVVYLTMLVGSAWMAATVCATLAFVVILAVLSRARARLAWALVLPVQPVVALGAIAYPARLLTCALLAAALAELVEYVRRPRLNPLTNGAVALAGLVLLDWSVWPAWLVIVAGLALALDAPWQERLTLCVVALFPALAASGTWLYLNFTESGWAWYFRDVPELSLDGIELWSACADPLGCAGSPAALVPVVAPVILLAVIVTLWHDGDGASDGPAPPARRLRPHLGTAIILATPIVVLLLRAWRGPAMTPLDAAVLALAAAIAIAATAQGTPARVVSWAFLAIVAVTGWIAVLAGGGEPPALVAAVRSGRPTPVAAPAVHMADRIRAARRDGDALLLDDISMFPVVGLLDAGSWIPSSSWEFHLAAERPAPYAHYVLQAEGRPSLLRSQLHVPGEVLAESYQVVAKEGALRLYQRRADWRTERSLR